MTKGFEQLKEFMSQVHGFESQEYFRAVETTLRGAALGLAREGYRLRRDPNGKPWRGPSAKGSGGTGGDLIMSGAMYAGLKVENRQNGFALVDRVAAPGGQMYGGTHNYGRTIRAKGYDPVRAAVTIGGKTRMRAVRGPNGKFSYTKAPGAKPLTWRTPDGRWHRAFKIRIPARPVVPPPGQLPSRWAVEFEQRIYDTLYSRQGFREFLQRR